METTIKVALVVLFCLLVAVGFNSLERGYRFEGWLTIVAAAVLLGCLLALVNLPL